MSFKMFKNVCLSVICLTASYSASAITVNWTVDALLINNSTGARVETMAGAFSYNTDTSVLSNIDLKIFDLGGAELFSYNFARPRSGFHIVDFFESDPNAGPSLTGESWVAIGFNLGELPDYSNSLGSFPISNFITDPNFIVQSSRQECISSDCFTSTGVITVAIDGTLTGTVVPVPAAVWLFGSGLIGLVSLARRKA